MGHDIIEKRALKAPRTQLSATSSTQTADARGELAFSLEQRRSQGEIDDFDECVWCGSGLMQMLV